MPELPEVETVVRELQRSLKGRSFGKITKFRENIRLPIPDLSKLEGRKITSITRRAKYILIDDLVMHLGMSGTISVGKPRMRKKHDHVVFSLDNGEEMVFADPRRFGLVVYHSGDLFDHLGPEPFAEEFNADYLYNRLQKLSAAVKISIMNQELVVGVGNIYASEALFDAKISPKRPSNKVKKAECEKLVKSIHKVLVAAIESGGSTLRDYVRSSGDLGYFQHQHNVYDKAEEPCVICKNPIEQLVQGGRSTYYCSKCQK